MTLGIVGHEAAKFTFITERQAREAIREALDKWNPARVVSGGCHPGGIDIWAIEEAKAKGIPTQEFIPTRLRWSGPGGFEERNRQIADASDVVLVVLAKELPKGYAGMAFPYCYHCHTDAHLKSGGCWTARVAQRMGKRAEWSVV